MPGAKPSAEAEAEVKSFMDRLVQRCPGEPEFQQAVEEVVTSVMPFVLDHPVYMRAGILDRLTEPDRVISFRVTWEDDGAEVHTNRAWRVQFSNAIGPYKGGLRFTPVLTQSVLKFLGFEQTLKNALTGLPMGGAKGGANFDPKGRSDREVMRFCQALMTELQRHIGEDVDVPAGDLGVGEREISYLFGQYKRIADRFTGTLTGKGLTFGGSLVRTEATGYGAVYFAQEMLGYVGDSLEGKRCVISGAGNVALYTAEKALEQGARVVTLSDSDGTVHDPDGLNLEKLAFVQDLKEQRRGRLREYAEAYGLEHLDGRRPWDVDCEVAFPCATQNELDADGAESLIANGCFAVIEGANMPCSAEAVARFADAGTLYAPGKAANAGGVAVSGLEQSQNALRVAWSREEVDGRLREIMHEIHQRCVDWGGDEGRVDYVKGANLAGFVKVADAMVAHGIV